MHVLCHIIEYVKHECFTLHHSNLVATVTFGKGMPQQRCITWVKSAGSSDLVQI